MNKLTIVISAVQAVALVGCPGDDPDKKCTATCNGALVNTECAYYGSQYIGGTVTCNTSTCKLDFGGCQTTQSSSQSEYEACGNGAGNCESGLTCRNPLDTMGMGENLCWRECDASAATDPCGTDRACFSMTGSSDGVCFTTTAGRDDECLLNGFACVAGFDCDQTIQETPATGAQFNCKLGCTEAELNTQGSCPAGELCLNSGWIFPLDPDELCANPGTPDTCSLGRCYDGWNDSQTRCGEMLAWCGTLEPLLGSFTQNDINTYLSANPGCNDIDGHAMCGIQNYTGDPASAECTPIREQNGTLIGVCVAICEQQSGPDLDCGDDGAGNGYICVLPPPGEEFYYNTQGGCTDDAQCDTGAGYRCVDGFSQGKLCARPLKMCMTP